MTFLTNRECEEAGYFCMLLARPELEPWFIAHIESHTKREHWNMLTPFEKFGSTWLKFCLLEEGIAATPYLIFSCKENHGAFKIAVREYTLNPTTEMVERAMSHWLSLLPDAKGEQR